MNRSRLYQHLPHALLLTCAAIGLSLTPGTPKEITTPQADIETGTATDVAVGYDRSYLDAEGDTRSIGDIIRQVRARMDANKQPQDAEAVITDTPTPLASLMAEPEHRRMVKRQDITPLPKAEPMRPTLAVEYAENANPLTWQPPETIAAREYNILAYGEVGGEEPQTAINPSTAVQTSEPTNPAGVFTTAPDADTPLLAAAPPTAEVFASPQPVATSDTPVIQAAQARSASAQAPTPLASQTSPALQTEPARTTEPATVIPFAKTPTQAPTPEPSTQNVFANDLKSAEKTQAAGPERGWTEKQIVVTKPTTTHNTPGVATPKPVISDKHEDDHPAQSSTPVQDKRTNPLLVYIDEPNKIGSDRIKAIDNALNRINQAADKAGLGVELKTTTDKGSGYNIRFAEDDGKDMGNKLGLAEFAVTEDKHGNEFFLGENRGNQGGKAKISINNAFNWFAGDDADDIDDDEYDYQTAVEHEFLHLLGLDDDFDNLDSVSHGLLSPGEVRREIHDREIDTLTDLFSNANPWRSVYSPSAWANSFNWGWGKTRYHAKALTAAVVPEPASLGLIGLSLMGAMQRRLR